MITKATGEFGCDTGDWACYCKNDRFNNGVRDCSAEAQCGGNGNAAAIRNYAAMMCTSGGDEGEIA